MRTRSVICCFLVFAPAICSVQDSELQRGAAGVTFNRDPKETERLLQEVIAADPRSSEAYEAYEWLSHLYFYRGQYRSLVAVMEKRWISFPEKKENAQEQLTMNGFRGLPNQEYGATSPSNITHEKGSIFIPMSIEGKPATYFFDTGAWISCMSESEADRLGLKIQDSSGKMGQSAGAQVGFRTTVAANVVIGNTHFRDVSFAVFPDREEPWSHLPRERKGIIGIPLLMGLKTLRWHAAGGLDVAQASAPFDAKTSNLVFDNDHLVVTASTQGQNIRATVDTGAVSTDLYQPFADQFVSLLSQSGKKGFTTVRGVGHAEKFPSVTIPRLKIRLGGSDVVLGRAHVLLKPIGPKCCVGNFGMDLFKQTGGMSIDFGAMTLELFSASNGAAELPGMKFRL